MARSTSKGSGRAAGSAAAGSGTAGAHEHESAQTYRGHAYDIGGDEAWTANLKRTYDLHQTFDHDSSLHGRADWEDQRQARARHMEELHQLTMQLLQNGIESANMVAKQAIRHGDLAIDREWNIDEVAQLVAKNPVFLDAIAAAVAQAVQTANE